MRNCDKRDSQRVFEEQMAQRESDWKARIDRLELEATAMRIKVTSLTSETEQLREDRTVKSHIAESSETLQRRLENEMKQSKWELEDYRAMCTRRIQDLESQIAFSQQSQKTLVENYERKIVQSEVRLQETVDRHEKSDIANNENVTRLNGHIRQLKEQLSENETKLARVHWKVEDISAEKTKLIEAKSEEKAKMAAKIAVLEDNDNTNLLKEEVARLQKVLNEAKEELLTKSSDVKCYQTKLADTCDELNEAERQRARLELDHQRKCDQIQREEYEKSQKLLSRISQAKERGEATVKRLEKEAALHQQAIITLKKDRNDAYNTLKANGLQITFAEGNGVQGDINKEDMKLQKQNENLKSVIAKMRHEMENLSKSGADRSSNFSQQNSLYVKALEEEVSHLKHSLRSKELMIVDADQCLPDDDTVAKEIVAKLNSTIGQLRTEKVELMTAGRKQQVELEHLKTRVSQMQASPQNVRIELDQAKYELNAVTRRFSTEASSLQQRIEELQTRLESASEEAAEYHKNLLSMNADNQALSTELSNLKMSQARSDNVVNYGAQELFIQSLQDEVSRFLLYLCIIMCKHVPNLLIKYNELSRVFLKVVLFSYKLSLLVLIFI